MKKEDLQKASKLFCENVVTGYSPEYFVVGMQSGQNVQMYSLTPAHTKRLMQKLQSDLAAYEEKHGAINTKWNPNVVSPIQRANPPSDIS